MKQQSAKVQHIDNIDNGIQYRRGGPSSISTDAIISYSQELIPQKQSLWLPQVQQFYNQILDDQLLKDLFSDKILLKMNKYRNGRILGDNIIQAMGKINLAIQTPPSFADHQITGVPLLSLFMQYLQSYEGQIFFSQSKVNTNLKRLFSIYSSLLDSPQSLKYIKTWTTGEALKYWDPEEFEVDLTHDNLGFTCWHDFFLRRFKDSVRPICQGEDQVANVCEHYPLLAPEMPVRNIKLNDQFWLKDTVYSLQKMVDSSRLGAQLVSQFVGGTVYQGFLTPWTYHRWHSPVDGKILSVYNIPGFYYVQNPSVFDLSGKNQNYINSQPFLSCTSTRQVFLIDADNKKIGKIIVILVGMAEVSTCTTTHRAGDRVKKGEHIGEFRFGGSSHCLIFNKDCKLDFSSSLEKIKGNNEGSNQQKSRKVLIRSCLARVE